MTTIGRYEIHDQIGTGSMGTVYRAHDVQLDREVALKTIRTGIDVEPEIRERFFREARACARLQHPSIVTVYDLGEEKSIAYIAMELLRGCDFRQLIRGRAELSLAAKLEIMVQICEALGHAHRHGVIHRDVKPSNLFLINQRQAKVLDFGIARLPSSHLTIAGKILGTPNYMSPEQILGKPVDARSDLFSVAIVFFEFLVYAHPFQSQTIPKRIVESEPDSLFDHDAALPPVFDKIFARALAKDSAQRYRSGDEFADDLRAVLDVVRQNASPSFSALPQLPSERALEVAAPEPKPEPDLQLLQAPPAGEDPYEWRFSEIMRLMPQFEKAMDAGDEAVARRLIGELEAIAAVDGRFAEAVSVCRSHLATFASNDEQAGEQQASDPNPSTPVICSGCGEENRNSARFCRNCGASLEALAEPKTDTVAARPVTDDATQIFGLDTPTRAVAESGPASGLPVSDARQPSATPRNQYFNLAALRSRLNPLANVWAGNRLVVAGAGLTALIVLIVLAIALRSVPVAPAAASASVAVPHAAIYKRQSAQSGTIVVLNMNDRVRVLKGPQTGDQPWVEAQFVAPNGRAFRPGYMRTRDLKDWDSRDAETALSLIQTFRADQAQSEREITSVIAALDVLADRFPGTPAAAKAHLLMARLELRAIRRMKLDHADAAVWRPRLDAASTDLAAVGSDPALQSQVAGLRKDIDDLSQQPAAPEQPTPHRTLLVPEPSIESLLAGAEKLRDQHKFDAAERTVNRALARDPSNAKALELREHIRRSRSFFNDQP